MKNKESDGKLMEEQISEIKAQVAEKYKNLEFMAVNYVAKYGCCMVKLHLR